MLDTAWDIEATDEQWLRGVTRALLPVLDDGTGIEACQLDLSRPQPFFAPLLKGGTPEWQRVWRTNWWDKVIASSPRETQQSFARFGPVFSTTALYAAVAAKIESFAQLLRTMASEGMPHALAPHVQQKELYYPDSLNLVALDGSGVGAAFIANRRAPMSALTMARQHAALTRLVSHLTAAVRLRRSLKPGSALTDGAAGVMAPNGKVLHAREGTGKGGLEALREAARAVVAAKSRAVEDPLSLWLALHAGRWSVVEQFEADGRRILVARENRARTSLPVAGLTQREQDVLTLLALGKANKEIGYDLGIAPTTVSAYLKSAAARLGVPGGRTLVKVVRALQRKVA